MDHRQVGLGALLLFLSSAVMLHTGIVESRVPLVVVGMTALSVAAGVLVTTRTEPSGR
jgi:hypothetical protein